MQICLSTILLNTFFPLPLPAYCVSYTLFQDLGSSKRLELPHLIISSPATLLEASQTDKLSGAASSASKSRWLLLSLPQLNHLWYKLHECTELFFNCFHGGVIMTKLRGFGRSLLFLFSLDLSSPSCSRQIYILYSSDLPPVLVRFTSCSRQIYLLFSSDLPPVRVHAIPLVLVPLTFKSLSFLEKGVTPDSRSVEREEEVGRAQLN